MHMSPVTRRTAVSAVLALLAACLWSCVAVHSEDETSSLTGLLMNSLFTFEDEACDQEALHIRCPHGTTISIQFAQYGRQVAPSEMCPPLNVRPGQPLPAQNTNCLAPLSLQVVMDLCQDQRQCKLRADARTFGHDPCPGTSKYLEVAYKCRPNEFQSRITCEGEEMILKCPKSKRLAVYSASFGSTNEGHVQCPTKSRTDYTGECQSKKALHKVMNMCFGRRHCNIRSDEETFGRPCPPGVTKVLNVVYTCVPHRLLGKLVAPFHTASKGRISDETTTASGDYDYPNRNRNKEGELKEKVGVGIVGQPGFVPKHSTYDYKPLPTPTVDSATFSQTQPGDPCVTTSTDNSRNETDSQGVVTPVLCVTLEPRVGAAQEDEYVGFVTDWIRTVKFLEENREKLILYITVALLTGLTLLLLLVIAMLLHDRRRSSRQAKLDVTDSVPVADTSHSTNASIQLNQSRSQNSSNRDSLLDTSSERNDNIDLIHYNVRSLSRHPTLSRPAPHTLSRVHFEEPPSTFMSDPEHVRSDHVRSTRDREVSRSLYDLDNVRVSRDLDQGRPTPSYSNFYR